MGVKIYEATYAPQHRPPPHVQHLPDTAVPRKLGHADNSLLSGKRSRSPQGERSGPKPRETTPRSLQRPSVSSDGRNKQSMFLLSRRAVFLGLVATVALLAPAGAMTDSMTTDTAADQATEPYYSDMTETDTATDEEDSDEPSDSGLECSDDFLGDGQCDLGNNSAACGYDGGDCCECTCSPKDFNCGGSYRCEDPDAECFGDDDGTGGVMTTMELDNDDATERVTEDTDNDTDSATGSGPRSFVSAGLAAAAGAAVVIAGWGL